MNIHRNILYFIILLVTVLFWEFTAQNNTVLILLSKPTLITTYFFENLSKLLEAVWITTIEAFFGLLTAAIFSFLLMILCLYWPKFMEFILPLMITSQIIPLITLAPLFIVAFGSGIMAKIMMAALLCFFPIFVNFANGVRLIDQNIKDFLFINNATTAQRIWIAYIPLALPNIMAGLKIAATLAVIGAIVAEFNGAEAGLGKNLFLAAKRLEPELMISSFALSALLGSILYGLISFIEKSAGKWYLN